MNTRKSATKTPAGNRTPAKKTRPANPPMTPPSTQQSPGTSRSTPTTLDPRTIDEFHAANDNKNKYIRVLVKTVVNLTDSRVFTLVDTTGAISLKVNDDMKQSSKLDLAALTLNNTVYVAKPGVSLESGSRKSLFVDGNTTIRQGQVYEVPLFDNTHTFSSSKGISGNIEVKVCVTTLYDVVGPTGKATSSRASGKMIDVDGGEARFTVFGKKGDTNNCLEQWMASNITVGSLLRVVGKRGDYQGAPQFTINVGNTAVHEIEESDDAWDALIGHKDKIVASNACKLDRENCMSLHDGNNALNNTAYVTVRAIINSFVGHELPEACSECLTGLQKDGNDKYQCRRRGGTCKQPIKAVPSIHANVELKSADGEQLVLSAKCFQSTLKTMLGYPTADTMHESYIGKQVVAVLRRNADNHYTLCMVDDVTEVNVADDDDDEEEEFIFNEE